MEIIKNLLWGFVTGIVYGFGTSIFVTVVTEDINLGLVLGPLVLVVCLIKEFIPKDKIDTQKSVKDYAYDSDQEK